MHLCTFTNCDSCFYKKIRKICEGVSLLPLKKQLNTHILPSLRLGYLSKKTSFVSSAVSDAEYLNGLSNFFNIYLLPFNYKSFVHQNAVFKSLYERSFDYLYYNMRDFSIFPILYRDKYSNEPNPDKTRHIIVMRATVHWFYKYLFIAPFLRKTDIVISPSLFAINFYRCFVLKPHTIHHIPHFVHNNAVYSIGNDGSNGDINDNNSNKPQQNSDSKIVSTKTSDFSFCYIGKMGIEKGILCSISMIFDLIKKGYSVKLHVISPIEDSFSQLIQKKVIDMKISDSVIFHGLLIGDEKYKILSSCDVLLNLTTATGENFPKINIEAFSCKIPILGTRWLGMVETIKENYNGVFVKVVFDGKTHTVDYDDLLSKATFLLENRDFVRKLSDGARSSYSKYDGKEWRDSFFKVLSSLCDGGEVFSNNFSKNIYESIKDKKLSELSDIYDVGALSALGISSLKFSDLFKMISYDKTDVDLLKKAFEYYLKKYPADAQMPIAL